MPYSENNFNALTIKVLCQEKCYKVYIHTNIKGKVVQRQVKET